MKSSKDLAVEAVNDRNTRAEYVAERKAEELVSSIILCQRQIKELQEALEGHRKALRELSYEQVKLADLGL